MKHPPQRMRPLPRTVYIPGRDHLERGVFDMVRIHDRSVLFCGNGPNLTVMQVANDFDEDLPFKAPFVEIRVFPIVPQIVRGTVDMFQDDYLIAYSESYFAVIGERQLQLGGTLCASRIVSTGAFIVGGRRTAENTVQFFFENGAVEEYVISEGHATISINRVSSLKFSLPIHSKITSTMFRDSDLLGLSDGSIVRASGAVILRQSPDLNSAIIQMTMMDKTFLLCVLGNGTIALVDITRHSLLSSIEGRFTAIERVIKRATFIAGDLDGSLHIFSVEDGQLIHRMTFKDRFRGKICQIINLRRSHIVVGTVTGGLRVLNRESLLPKKERGQLCKEFPINSAQFTLMKAGWIYIENDKVKFLPCKKPYPLPKYPVGNNFSERGVRMKYFYGVHRETICCYGKNTLCFITTEGPSGFASKTETFTCELEKYFTSAAARIISLILQEDYVFVQCDDNYQVVFFVDFRSKTITRKFAFIPPSLSTTLTAASILERDCSCTGPAIMFVAGYKDGSVAGFVGKLEADPLRLKSVMVNIRNSYVVSSIPRCDAIFLLTAKGMCFELWEPCLTESEFHNWNKSFETLVVRREWSLGGIIGKGRSISDAGLTDLIVSGFKGNTLNLYNVLRDDHVISVETAGPRRPFQVMLTSWYTENVLTLMHTIPNVNHPILRNVALPAKVSYADLCHSAPINIMRYLKCIGDPTVYVITGDSSGLLLYSKFTQVTTHSVELIGDFQLDGAILCTAFEKEVLFVSTSNGFVYKFERFFEEMLLTPSRVMRIESPAESMVIRTVRETEILCLCRDGVLRVLHDDGSVTNTVHFTPGSQKGSEVVELDTKLRVFYSLGKDSVLQRTQPYSDKPSDEHIRLNGVPLSSFYMRGGAFEGSIDEIVAGTPDGWLYLMWFNRKDNNYIFTMADRFHAYPIIEIRWYCVMHDGGRYNVISMDSSGFVVVREFKVSPSKPYLTLATSIRKWQSPVNSPRALEVFPEKGEMFVCGEGASWYYILDERRD